jgi:lysophospholipase L1-like esterase
MINSDNRDLPAESEHITVVTTRRGKHRRKQFTLPFCNTFKNWCLTSSHTVYYKNGITEVLLLSYIITEPISSRQGSSFTMSLQFSTADHLLFIGDSITDCGRMALINPLGNGYVAVIAHYFKKRDAKPRISNRGIGGNTSGDLAQRWEKDCLNLNPSVISILIGINDTWRHYDQGVETSLSTFEKNYRSILDRTKEQTDATLILCEPFLLPLSDEQKLWHFDLDPKRRLIRGLANEYGTLFISLHEAFQKAASASEPTRWTEDGVHPTDQGHLLIADTWIKEVRGEAPDVW